jgi:hypothetical protein
MTSSVQSRLEHYRGMRLRHLLVLAIYIDQVPFEMGGPRQSVCLELLKERCSGKIAFKFAGVQDLKMARIHPGTICRLEIVSVANDQLEGVRFHVFNDEQDFVLGFYCFDFEVSELPIGS